MLAGVAVLVLFLLLAIAVAVQWFRPSADVLVSEATTYITAPLGDDGLPDYQHALQQYQTIPESPQQNGAVPFWKAMGEPSLEPSNWDQISAALQLDPQAFRKGLCAASTELSEEIPTWFRQTRGLDKTASVDSHGILIHAATVPWRPEECIPLAEAIQHHHQQLEWLHDAASSPVFYSPPLANADELDLGFELCMSFVNSVDWLLQRAQLRLGSGELDLAWRDLRASLILCDRVPTQFYVGYVVHAGRKQRTQEALCSLLAHPDFAPDLAAQVFNDRALSGQEQDFCMQCLQTERLFSLGYVLHRIKNPNSEPDDPTGFLPPEVTRHLQAGSVDWNLVLRYMNGRFDRMESILREPRRDGRWQAWQQLEAERQAAWAHVQSQMARDVGFFSRQRRSQLIAEEFMDSSISQFGRILNLHHQLLARTQLIALAGTIVLHRSRYGELPIEWDFDGLDTESPAFDQQTVVYQRLDSGFLLYDFGFNGRDDGGSDGVMANYRGIRLFGSKHDQPGVLKRILTRYGEAEGVADDDTFSTLVSEDADDVALRVQESPASLTEAISDAIESP